MTALKIEAACCSEKLINCFQITQCCILLDNISHDQHENLKLTLYYFIILEVGHNFLPCLNAIYTYENVPPVLLRCFLATHLSVSLWEKDLYLHTMKLNGKGFMLKRIGIVHIIPFLTLFHKNELEWEN